MRKGKKAVWLEHGERENVIAEVGRGGEVGIKCKNALAGSWGTAVWGGETPLKLSH